MKNKTKNFFKKKKDNNNKIKTKTKQNKQTNFFFV